MGQGRFSATARADDSGFGPCRNVQRRDAQAEVAGRIEKGEVVNVDHASHSLPHALLEGLREVGDVLLHHTEKVALRGPIAGRGKDQTP
jgi:hypothetical protein